MIETVTVERGKPDQRATLNTLAQLYIHDFTEFLGAENLDVGEDGRFDDEIGLQEYWTGSRRSVWFIRADGKLAGFVLLDSKTRSGKPADFVMAQFFVLRAYRGKDVAGRAVEQILNSHPGQWEIAIMERNAPALRFWPRAVARANMSELETLTGQGDNPSRTLLRFVVS
jgi:predicted acetyltransferase